MRMARCGLLGKAYDPFALMAIRRSRIQSPDLLRRRNRPGRLTAAAVRKWSRESWGIRGERRCRLLTPISRLPSADDQPASPRAFISRKSRKKSASDMDDEVRPMLLLARR